jgi:hypothetical protein
VDAHPLIRLPLAPKPDPDAALEDLLAAIQLVERGFARRVIVANRDGLDSVAAEALAAAQAAAVTFTLARDGLGVVRAIVGPREV